MDAAQHLAAVGDDAWTAYREWRHQEWAEEKKRREANDKAIKAHREKRGGRDGAISAGGEFALAIREGSGGLGWGCNSLSQTHHINHPFFAQFRVSKMCAGEKHSVVMYPPANNGQRSLGFSGFSREGFWTDASAGDQYTLALRADGDVDCFGDNANKCAPKKGKKGPFVAVSAGGVIAVALKPGGGVEHWGKGRDRLRWGRRDTPPPPSGVTEGDFVAVSAGYAHTLALRKDGSVKAFGGSGYSFEWNGINGVGGIADWAHLYHHPELDGATDRDGPFVQVAAGYDHSLGLRSDGTIDAWGGGGEPCEDCGSFAHPSYNNEHGQLDVPPGQFVAISAGRFFSMALRPDGEVVCWGKNNRGQAPVASIGGAKLFALEADAAAPVAVVPEALVE